MGIIKSVSGWVKNLFAPQWKISGPGSSGFYDPWNTKREPGYTDLIRAVNETASACIRLICDNMAGLEYNLFFQTDTPELVERRASRKTIKFIKNTFPHLARRVKGENLEEVTNHPFLDLWYSPNEEWSYTDLIRITQTFLEVTGNAYWYLAGLERNPYPTAIYILPSQNMEILKDAGQVVGYKYDLGTKSITYKPSTIIHFAADPDLTDIYGYGVSPLRRVYQKIQLGDKEQTFWENYLDNQGRPDAILTPESDMISPMEAERVAKEFTQRFRTGGAGGILVPPFGMKLQPLTYAPKDLAQLELYKQIKTAICNQFGVPLTVFEMPDSSYATAEAGNYYLAVHAIKPRVNALVEKINRKLLPLFGDDRVFLCPENFVPEDKVFELQEKQAMYSAGALLPNEWREAKGLDPLPGGDRPANQFALPSFPSQGDADLAAEPQEQPEPVADIENPVLPASVLNGAQISSAIQVVSAVATGQLPRDAGIGSLMVLLNLTEEQAETIMASVGNGFVPTNPDAPQVNQDAPKSVPTVQGKALAKAPSVDPLAGALRKFFAMQREAVLVSLKDFDPNTITTKSILDREHWGEPSYAWKVRPEGFIDLSEWTEQMRKDLFPMVELFANYGAKQTLAQIGGREDLFSVVQPGVRKATQELVLQFCEETNQTTSLILSDALAKLRDELAEGIEQGERRQKLTARVNEVFDMSEVTRADRIAYTESHRAIHNAATVTAKESGVVTSKKWLPAGNGCPACLGLAARGSIPLDQPFEKSGNGPYDTVNHPPLHPNCRCSILFDLSE